MEDFALSRDEARMVYARISENEDKDKEIEISGSLRAEPAEDVTGKSGKPEILLADAKTVKPGTAKIETVYEKIEISDQADSVTDANADSEKPEGRERSLLPSLDDPFFEIDNKRGSGARIYSVSGTPSGRINRRTTSSTVFPAGCMGCREDLPLENKASARRFVDAKQTPDCVGHIENTPRKRTSSGKLDTPRNPLTGAGIELEDSRRQTMRRKDGNPLLGVGYEDAPHPSTPNSTGRVPPGGYSHRLW